MSDVSARTTALTTPGPHHCDFFVAPVASFGRRKYTASPIAYGRTSGRTRSASICARAREFLAFMYSPRASSFSSSSLRTSELCASPRVAGEWSPSCTTSQQPRPVALCADE